jgi:hypothetical protein
MSRTNFKISNQTESIYTQWTDVKMVAHSCSLRFTRDKLKMLHFTGCCPFPSFYQRSMCFSNILIINRIHFSMRGIFANGCQLARYQTIYSLRSLQRQSGSRNIHFSRVEPTRLLWRMPIDHGGRLSQVVLLVERAQTSELFKPSRC